MPKTLHDKWLWRKVFDRHPVYQQLTDKLGVRDWIRDNGIDVALVDVLWEGDDARDIPDEFFSPGHVIKTNHGCATNIFLKEPPYDREAIIEEANDFLKLRFGRRQRMFGYYGIEPKLFVEPFVEGLHCEVKYFTFGGRIPFATCIYLEDNTADMWLLNEDGTTVRSDGLPSFVDGPANRPLPEFFAQGLEHAREISKHFDHMRVDFMHDGQRLLLGELTVYNLGGNFRSIPIDEWGKLNDAWDILDSPFFASELRGWRRWYANAVRRTRRGQAT
ncbi:MAG: ATP-grasp fold amidoligase family protein [Pseudomonadota bacterium]